MFNVFSAEEDDTDFTPLIGILAGVIITLVLICVLIAVVIRIKYNKKRKGMYYFKKKLKKIIKEKIIKEKIFIMFCALIHSNFRNISY